MKLALGCVATVLLSCVSGHDWFARRDTESEDPCTVLYASIGKTVQTGTFRHLLEDDQLTLDCSEQTMRRAEACQLSEEFHCNSQYDPGLMFRVLTIFCNRRSEIEAEASCWTSEPLRGGVESCARRGDTRTEFTNCVVHLVTSRAECSAPTGDIFRQLLSL